MEYVDYRAITERQQTLWASADFHALARQLVSVSEDLCRAVDPHARERVLDVACGSGNAALVAARRCCDVAGIDYVPALIGRARERAAAEGVEIDFRIADAQALPFPASSFDVVLSVFGVMFAPDQEKAACELVRVCRPGGRIGLASWTPQGFGADLFALQARYRPPPPGLAPAVRWGTERGLAELLGARAVSIASDERPVCQYYHSVEHAASVFCAYFGPINRVYEALDPGGRAGFSAELEAVLARYNRARDASLVLQSHYLQSIATRAGT